MQLLKQPNRWSCVPTSFAMALDISVDQMIELLGHDGSEIVRPNHDPPFCYKGFHLTECIYVAHSLGFSVTPFEIMPQGSIGDESAIDIWNEEEGIVRLSKILFDHCGVITGYTFQDRPHAVAWDAEVIYDPGTFMKMSIQSFKIETFWLVQKYA